MRDTIAKRRRLRDREAALAAVPEAQESFARHLARLRERTGLPLRVVASHGDFVNRSLGVVNHELLSDPDFRRAVGVELETYDEAFMRHVTSRHADSWPPGSWIPSDPLRAICRGDRVVYLLVHPRHWHADRLANGADDVRRLVEAVRYQLPDLPLNRARR